MKAFFHILVLLAALAMEPVAAQAQTPLPQGTFLFDTFTEGRILMKNKLSTRARFNYDCVRQQLHFMDRDQEMILDHILQVDTLYIGTRIFIPYQTRFVECITAGPDVLRVDWKAKIYNQGKKGAMGFVSQPEGSKRWT